VGVELEGISGAIAPSQDAAVTAAVSRVQRLVAERAAPETIYQAVLDEAMSLLGVSDGALRLVDHDDPQWTLLVAVRPARHLREGWRRRAPVGEGVSGRAIAEGKILMLTGGGEVQAGSRLAPSGIRATIAVPLRERGRVVGALVVGSRSPDRRFDASDRALMASYGAHVEVALTVAQIDHGAQQAFTDALTGLGNRALLLDRLDHRLAQADRDQESVTVLFLDLDRFKLVNDSLGHIIGDQLLVAVADRLRGCLREDDLAARLGGDEFAVLLARGSDAERVARRIIESLRSSFLIGGQEVFVGVSVGIASGRDDAETLLRDADVAMYQAKRAGSGPQRFVPRMHAALVSRLGIDAELRRAVVREELELHFQPLVDLGSGRIAGLESLVRWRHPERGLVPPAQFIPIAEETGQIVEIDRWVLAEACRCFARWWREAPLAITVNVSFSDLQQPAFAESVSEAIGGAFPPSALVLEVTESASLQNAPEALRALHDVKDLGVRVALDDFGTGYSSLLSLSQLPVDVLKIARPFIAGVPDAPKGRDLLSGMVALGRHLGLTTVAEGIESVAQHELLVALGCELGQGYLLGRPVAREATAALVGAVSSRPPAPP
jgi:diguanylate cyclase (GGDEF)-like protein